MLVIQGCLFIPLNFFLTFKNKASNNYLPAFKNNYVFKQNLRKSYLNMMQISTTYKIKNWPSPNYQILKVLKGLFKTSKDVLFFQNKSPKLPIDLLKYL